jgi:hypothetical protein
MRRTLKSSTVALIVLLGITLFVWVLRGFAVLSFIPGSVLWVLLLLCVITAIMSVAT